MAKLDLDALQPDDLEVVFRGRTYRLPGTLPLPTIMRMQQLEDRAAGTDEDAYTAFVETYELVMGIFRERQPKCPDLPLSPEDVAIIVSRLAGGTGAEKLSALIAEGIGGPESQNGAGNAAEGDAVDPLPSAKPSRRRSSRSAA